MHRTHARRLALLLLMLALVASACRTGDVAVEDEGEDAEEPADAADDDEVVSVSTDIGVTDEPCPDAVNEDNGCIYLGVISDLTVGPFAALAVPLTDAQAEFWRRVNEDGGIGGYDIDASSYVRDNEYNPEVHVRVFEEIRGEVLALAQSLGSPQTAAILDDLRGDDIVAAPASWTSAWEFEDVIVESGASYCFEAMNAVDFAFEEMEGIETVMAVHYPGDYGDDAAYGAQVAAEAGGADFVNVETPPGADNQAEAIEAVVSQEPQVVFITTGPLEMATIVGQAAARGYQGRFIGSSPTWNPGLLDSPAADALAAMYWQAGPWGPWDTDTAGHEAMREALGDATPNDGYVAGWTWQYPLKAAIEAAIDRGDLTRAGLRAALEDLSEVDYEGILPPESGNFAPGDPNETAYRESLVSEVDPEAPTGVTVLRDHFIGPTAEDYELTEPCFQQL
jgi:ABC-type branched-subunit amino acid transport system substrate-binding protein